MNNFFAKLKADCRACGCELVDASYDVARQGHCISVTRGNEQILLFIPDGEERAFQVVLREKLSAQ